LEVVDYDLIAAVGSQGSLNSLGDRAAGIDVADYGAIFGVVATVVDQ